MPFDFPGLVCLDGHRLAVSISLAYRAYWPIVHGRLSEWMTVERFYDMTVLHLSTSYLAEYSHFRCTTTSCQRACGHSDSLTGVE